MPECSRPGAAPYRHSFRGEHSEEAGIIHRLINGTGKLPIGFGSCGVFGDQRGDALDRAKQIGEGLIFRDKASLFYSTLQIPLAAARVTPIVAFDDTIISRRGATAIFKRLNTTDRGGWL
jgi:hypothetical protein